MNTDQSEPNSSWVAGILILLLAIVLSLIGSGYLFLWQPYQGKRRQERAVRQLSGEATWAGKTVEELTTRSGGLDVSLAVLTELPKLRRLNLKFATVSDVGLRHLVACKELEELSLGHTYRLSPELDLVEYWHGTFQGKDLNTTEGMELLLQRIEDRMVVLRNMDITSDGMRYVAQVPALRVLSLENTGVGDEGLEFLSTLRLLEELDLRLTRVSDRGVTKLVSFPSLRRLDIGSNRFISDKALASVALIDTLEELRPPHQLSDQALRELHGLKRLRVLDLRDSKYTDAALRELQEALPECRVLLPGENE